MRYTINIYKSTSELPLEWNNVIGNYNILLSKEYFNALQASKPENMECYFVGFFDEHQLIGGALFQYLDFNRHNTFQKNEVLCSIRNFLAKRYSKNVLILGNNMLTGQNGFYFDSSKISIEKMLALLTQVTQKIQLQKRKASLIIYKDYQAHFIKNFEGKTYQSYFRFSVQPNMFLSLKENWVHFNDYLNNFSTKYRTRALSAKKKFNGIEKREMDLDGVIQHKAEMNVLYQNVAENAPFNTFFLPENHFEELKKNLTQNFKIFGYFLDKKLIGFYTLILNNKDIDTYFLGYDKGLQKPRQLYLNMLLDMVEFGITHQFKRIIFGRTALEIKSTIGAEPVDIFGLIKHNNALINPFLGKFFSPIEPKKEWIQRKPFKTSGTN